MLFIKEIKLIKKPTRLLESFNIEPNVNNRFDGNERLVGVFQSCIGEFELIYSSPICGIQADAEFKDL